MSVDGAATGCQRQGLGCQRQGLDDTHVSQRTSVFLREPRGGFCARRTAVVPTPASPLTPRGGRPRQIITVWLEGSILGTLLHYLVDKDPVNQVARSLPAAVRPLTPRCCSPGCRRGRKPPPPPPDPVNQVARSLPAALCGCSLLRRRRPRRRPGHPPPPPPDPVNQVARLLPHPVAVGCPRFGVSRRMRAAAAAAGVSADAWAAGVRPVRLPPTARRACQYSNRSPRLSIYGPYAATSGPEAPVRRHASQLLMDGH